MAKLTLLTLPVVLVALSYQFLTGPGSKLHDVFGIGRALETVNNEHCQKIPELQACEDMWMHRQSGLLYLACSDPIGRQNWCPAVDHLNHEKRPDNDHIAILDTRATGPIASRITRVKPTGFSGSLNLHGLDVWEIPAASSELKPTLRIILNNHRPPLDNQTGEPLQASFVGANSTFELFETTLGESHMRHVRSYIDPEIRTPNRPAFTGPDSFLFSNDHKDKVAKLRPLEMFYAASDVGFCDTKGCKSAVSPLIYPNGMVRSSINPRLFFVPSSADPNVRVFELQADNSLSLIDTIYVGYPVDNLTVDEEGNVYAAVFPKVLDLLTKHGKDPFFGLSPTAIRKISLNTDNDRFYGKKYKVETIFADHGEVASGITTGLFDEKTKRLYMGGVYTPYTIECQL